MGRRTRSKREGLPTDVSDAVRRLMRNRHAVLAPFKLDPMMLYRLLWSDPEWMALDTLKDAGVLRTGSKIKITEVTVGARLHRIEVDLPAQYPLSVFSASAEITLPELPPDIREEVTCWANSWSQLWLDTERVVSKVELVQKTCKTYAQLLRIWPELRGFLPEHVRRQADSAKTRSKYPEKAVVQRWDTRVAEDIGKIKTDFRPEVFEPFTVMLAEALMLPECTDFGIARVEGLSAPE